MRFGLSYLGKIIPLGPASSVIGRSVSCKVMLDDDAVSRRHARLKIEGDGLMIEDLDSANGVFVNDQRIEGWSMLSVGDRIQIGDQKMQVVTLDQRKGPPRTMQRRRSQRPRGPSAVDKLWDDDEADAEGGDPTRKSDRFGMLSSAMELAVKEGRPDAAEHLVEPALSKLLEQARTPGRVKADEAVAVANLALRLARDCAEPKWIDWVLELYTVLRLPLPSDLLAQLVSAVELLGPAELERLAPYLAALRADTEALGAAGLRTVRGLEPLLRVLQK